jgi:formylglycine-generating enzyme required for sulfatase activity
MTSSRAVVRLAVAGAIISGVALASACTSFGSAGPAIGPVGDASDATDARVGDAPDVVDAGAGAGSFDDGGCPSSAPPMVAVHGFCIDSREVTQEQYSAFLASTPKLEDQPSGCASNTSFTRRTDSDVELNAPTFPVSVNWCDAFMYCRWVGKRLCGAIGGGGSPFQTTDTTESEWIYACSAGGSREYSYGQTAEPTPCNVGSRGSGAIGPVGSFPGCVGGYDGLFDMSGNVHEWLDECADDDAGPAQNGCVFRGGAFNEGPTKCDDYGWQPRTVSYYGYGFRCCATPK